MNCIQVITSTCLLYIHWFFNHDKMIDSCDLVYLTLSLNKKNSATSCFDNKHDNNKWQFII